MIVIKAVDEDVYLDFKAEVVRRKRKLGDVLTEAMRLWLDQLDEKK